MIYHVAPVEIDGRPDYWSAVSTVPCPVPGCTQTVVWYEAGYVPGYRVCMAANGDGSYDEGSIRHHFQAGGTAERPTLELVRTAD